MTRSLSLLVLCLTASTLFAQRGSITGVVTAMENGKPEPQAFASVAIKGTTTGATTDMDGRYFFEVESGDYTVVTKLVGYEPVEKPVKVTVVGTDVVDLQFGSGPQEMKVVDIVKQKRIDTEAAVIMETRKSDQVVNGVGRQQIAKSQDRTAGDVVKRIPGVTILN